MPYCEDTDIELAFGRENVHKWADVDNDNLDASVTARKLWAREQATAELDARLAASAYQFPLASGDYPAILVRMCAYLAGVLLYESRGVTDVGEDGKATHALMWHRKRVDEFIRDVYGRRIVLIGAELSASAVTEVTHVPEFVSFDDPYVPGSSSGIEIEDNIINFPSS